MKKILLAIVIFLLLVTPAYSAEFPKPINYASDFANIIEPDWEAAINVLGEQIERNNTSQVFVATVDDTTPYVAKEYATRLFGEWKIGQKGKDNGVLILVALKPERRIEIETGYGIEGMLPDSKVARIRREYTPLLTEGKYGEGLYKMAKAIGDVIQGSGEFSGLENSDIWTDIIGFVVFIAIFVIIIGISIGGVKLNRPPKCPKCKTKMERAKSSDSGDYIITEFVCPKCKEKLKRKRRKSRHIGAIVVVGGFGGGGSGGGGFGGGGGGGSGGGGSGGGF